jgi:hypothetical protein
VKIHSAILEMLHAGGWTCICVCVCMCMYIYIYDEAKRHIFATFSCKCKKKLNDTEETFVYKLISNMLVQIRYCVSQWHPIICVQTTFNCEPDSSVSIATDWEAGVRSPTEAVDFFPVPSGSSRLWGPPSLL